MIQSEHLRRLHYVNALFAGLTGQDLYLAHQIEGAINASLAESGGTTPAACDEAPAAETEFVAAATRLLERLCQAQPDHGFFHWDATESAADATPLFVREHVMTGLKRLAPYREATLVITNLRPAHCPPRRRWTPRREHDYRETLSLIRDLAATRSRPSASVNLLFF
jgi:hypothetical protein